MVSFSYQIPPKSIGGFEIDAFINERYSFANSVTDVPLEDGSIASDHAVEKALEIHITGFVGKTEFTVWDGLGASVQGQDPKGRIKAAYFELLRLKAERQPLDLVTGLDTYPNMVITQFDIDRNAATGADLPFDMTFKQIRIVKSETTKINYSAPSADQTYGTGNMGVAGTKRTDPFSSREKEIWKIEYRETGGRNPTRDEYYQYWGEYP